MPNRLCLLAAGLFGAGAVAMAAVAAHGLDALTVAARAATVSAVTMQGWHALALLGLAAILPRGGWPLRLAAAGFALGTILFCGGVYGHELAGWDVAFFAPIGGTILIAAWLAVAAGAVSGRLFNGGPFSAGTRPREP